MALSMDEQRMLAEIERRLAAEDPGLASRLSSFRRPAPVTGFRTTRGKVVGAVCTVILVAVIGLTVYAMLSFRAHSQKSPAGRESATSQSATSRPATAAAPARSGATVAAGTRP